jgi:peptide/nickel transport system substrate-binding protein
MSARDNWDVLGRRWSRRIVVRGAVLSGAALTGAACAGAATPAAPAPAPAATAPPAAAAAPTTAPTVAPTPVGGTPKYGGTVKFGVTGETNSLDPHRTQSTLFYAQGVGLIYSRLVKPSGGPERKGDEILLTGDVAQEKIEQPDDLTYIFKLRPNVKFHNIAPVNGREMTMNDVVYSFERQRELRLNSAFLPQIEKMEVVDRGTLKITTPRPDADFLGALASSVNLIVAREAVESRNGDLSEGPHIGTGPWLYDSFERTVAARLKKNPDYFIRGVPYVDGVEFLRIAEPAVSHAAFRTQEIPVTNTHFTKKDVDELKRQFPQLTTTLSRTNGSGLEIGFDQARPPFNDRRVRQAISLGLDRQSIIDTAFDGAGTWGLILFAADTNLLLPEDEYKTRHYKRDVARARQLLAEAGVPTPLEVEFTIIRFSQVWDDAAQLAVDQLKEIGVNARLRHVDAAVWSAQTQTGQGDYQAYLGPLLPATSTTGDLRQRLHSTGTRNASKTKDPRLDEMIDRQATLIRDPAARRNALHELQRYVVEQNYVISINGFVSPGARWPWIKNYRTVGQPGGDQEPVTWIWVEK